MWVKLYNWNLCPNPTFSIWDLHYQMFWQEIVRLVLFTTWLPAGVFLNLPIKHSDNRTHFKLGWIPLNSDFIVNSIISEMLNVHILNFYIIGIVPVLKSQDFQTKKKPPLNRILGTSFKPNVYWKESTDLQLW